MLDEAVGYIAQDSLAAAQRLLIDALDAAASLVTLSERERRVPELEHPNTRELFVQRYRLIYEVHPTDVHILAFLHGARDFEKWRRETLGGRGAG
jgi:plasmid stabilization system protein ParE